MAKKLSFGSKGDKTPDKSDKTDTPDKTDKADEKGDKGSKGGSGLGTGLGFGAGKLAEKAAEGVGGMTTSAGLMTTAVAIPAVRAASSAVGKAYDTGKRTVQAGVDKSTDTAAELTGAGQVWDHTQGGVNRAMDLYFGDASAVGRPGGQYDQVNEVTLAEQKKKQAQGPQMG